MNISFSSGHVKALDGLRGIAILLVLMLHLYAFYPFSYISFFGWTGVDLFFVLSGFLITGILYDSKGQQNYYRNFIAKRVLRIFPLYYLVLTVFFFVDLFSHSPAFKYAPYTQWPLWTYTTNLQIALHGPAKSGLRVYLEHFWSLAIEEQFYLFWPFCIMLFSKKNILRISLALILCSVLLKNIYPNYLFSYFFTFSRIEGLLTGAILAILIREHKHVLERLVLPILLVTALILVATVAVIRSFRNGEVAYIRYGYTVIDLMFGCLLVCSFARERAGQWWRSLLENRMLRFFGKYSYGIYVYHWIVYSLLFFLMGERIIQYVTNAFLAKLITATICLGITLAVSVLSYQLFEKRFLKLKSRFTPPVKTNEARQESFVPARHNR